MTIFQTYFHKIVLLSISMSMLYFVLCMAHNIPSEDGIPFFGKNEITLNGKTYEVTHHEKIMSNNIVDVSNSNLDIIGHDLVVKEIDSIIKLLHEHSNESHNSIIQPPNGVLLYGPPGTGKTTLGKSISNKLSKDCNFIHISPDVLENKYYGEGLKHISAVFSLARKIKPCVIFFDEIDGFMSTRSALDQSHTNTMKTSILTCMDSIQNEWNVLFIATTNRKDALDPALLRRLDVKLNMGLPKVSEKNAFIRKYITTQSMSDEDVESFTKDFTQEYTLCDIKNFCKFAVRQYLVKDKLKNDKMNILKDDFINMFSNYVDLNHS